MKSIIKKITGKNALKADKKLVLLIKNSNLFDEQWYIESNPTVKEEGWNPIEHYLLFGKEQGLSPSYLFNSKWYMQIYNDVKSSNMDPLVHYIKFGQQEGRKPSIYFDPTFYAANADLDGAISPLAHYYEHAKNPVASPIVYFDPKYYLNAYPDIRESHLDPYFHYLFRGYKENRKPCQDFESQWYVEHYLGGDVEKHCLYYHLTLGFRQGNVINPGLLREENDHSALEIAKQPSHFQNTLQFLFNKDKAEEFQYDGVTLAPNVKALAYYLPQFYPFEENNEWWGEGFTEWTNVTRGRPRFEGHYQPHLPKDLGFYDLRVKETIESQVNMAKKAGLYGFCFYYYWFNGKRLLDKPLELFLNNKDIDFPFSLFWTNENWTRRWDGLDDDILIQQEYKTEDDDALIEDLVRYFSDRRYIRLDGRPLFFLYRPGIIPNAKERIHRWRHILKEKYNEEPLIFMAQGFNDIDPRPYGLDGAIEFPPHKVAQDLKSSAREYKIYDEHFSGHYPLYENMVTKSLNDINFEYDVIKTVTPSWDNEARKPGKGMGFIGATPSKYESWLKGVIKYSKENPILKKHNIVAINAWNEWAEGAHLEPDMYWGSAYLNATYRAIHDISELKNKYTILLIGHDAYLHGAQLLTLNIFKTLKRQFGVNVITVLLEGGPLEKEYLKIGETYICNNDLSIFDNTIELLKRKYDISKAICNTTVSGKVIPTLKSQNIEFINLIHELENLIVEYNLNDEAKEIALEAKRVIFASNFVKESFEKITGKIRETKVSIRPQGIYQHLTKSNSSRVAVRNKLNLDENSKLIINVGYGDLRKGFDLFINVAKLTIARDKNIHFLWLGNIDDSLYHWIKEDLKNHSIKDNIHFLPFSDNVSKYLSAADVFSLTSREDPFPSVVLEALYMGVPVVGFESGGGYADIINNSQYGQLVPMGDIDSMSHTVAKIAYEDSASSKQIRAERVAKDYNWNEYVFSLLSELDPSLKKVTVVVPNYNYERHIRSRLQTVFEQHYPIYEIIVLDDMSTDNSVEVIKSYAEECKRDISLTVNNQNSGNVFKQWQKGVDKAKGDYIWIAEADDLSRSSFLSSVLSGKDDFTMAYTDSMQINELGEKIADDYTYYYCANMKKMLKKKRNYSGQEFIRKCLSIKNQILNVSAVVFKRDCIASFFKGNLDTLTNFTVAGDWYLYISLLSYADSKIKLIADPLNIHRRHMHSVTKKLDADKHLQEIISVHKFSDKFYSKSNKLNCDRKDYLKQVEKYLVEES